MPVNEQDFTTPCTYWQTVGHGAKGHMEMFQTCLHMYLPPLFGYLSPSNYFHLNGLHWLVV